MPTPPFLDQRQHGSVDGPVLALGQRQELAVCRPGPGRGQVVRRDPGDERDLGDERDRGGRRGVVSPRRYIGVMPNIPAAAAPTPPAPYGGYALTKVRHAGGDETVRIEATLLLGVRPIAHVSNGGEGGSHRWSPVAPDGWAEIAAFNADATE